jgi:hypothetical protein
MIGPEIGDQLYLWSIVRRVSALGDDDVTHRELSTQMILERETLSPPDVADHVSDVAIRWSPVTTDSNPFADYARERRNHRVSGAGL